MTHPIPDTLAASDALATVLADPGKVQATVPSDSGRAWSQSLAGGAAGIALLHIERAHSGHGDEALAHAWLRAAFTAPVTAAANANLYVGAPALAFVTHAAAASAGRSQHTLATLDQAVANLTRARLEAAHARIDRGELPEMKEFDLIRGLTGLGVYHLRCNPDHELTHDVLAYLVRLTQPLPTRHGLPAWWTPVAPNGERDPDEFPGGHGNLGLSHGISAPLALLSLAALRGMPVPGLAEAIGRVCAWTDDWLQHDHVGPWWPGLLTHRELHEQHVDPSLRPRPSWCYGVAGTARAQQLAGLALNDTERRRTAEQAVLTTLRNPALPDLLPDLGLCHGMAGLLQAAWRIAGDALDDQITAELPGLASQLVARLPPLMANPELLDGTAGIALALHTFGTNTAPTSGWDAVLLLAL
ncbi:lanthionine synthetase C family protein [Streptosporangium sp. NPDC001681]|uniref:lanthionine synthetase C family protein n=1 Tax=Streptosporangium sp. NPDC001681 TaxID=3154395 RepID=UPI0033314630